MKYQILIPILTISTLATAWADGSGVGRFQLVPAIVETSADGGTRYSERTVFKIDTVTGKTWEFLEIMNGKKLTEEWIEIEN